MTNEKQEKAIQKLWKTVMDSSEEIKWKVMKLLDKKSKNLSQSKAVLYECLAIIFERDAMNEYEHDSICPECQKHGEETK